VFLPTKLVAVAEAAGLRIAGSRELYPALHGEDQSGLPMLVVENALGRAVIALMGAHLMSFRPAGKEEFFWISPRSPLTAGTPIRGGIPLCLPWFGPNAEGGPQHGFARTQEWALVDAEALADGRSRVVLELRGDDSHCPQWPHAFLFQLAVTVGSELDLTMTVENLSEKAAPLSFAFHTYFAVPDVAQAKVQGLEGVTYIDKMDGFIRKQQQGAVQLTAATDNVYLDAPRVQTVQAGKAAYEIRSRASCAVVWNAWNNDRNIADIGEGNHVGYLCVERGDVMDRALVLEPGMIYTAEMTLAAK
jgi:D-hexose-6-phosphate mutarotase